MDTIWAKKCDAWHLHRFRLGWLGESSLGSPQRTGSLNPDCCWLQEYFTIPSVASYHYAPIPVLQYSTVTDCVCVALSMYRYVYQVFDSYSALSLSRGAVDHAAAQNLRKVTQILFGWICEWTSAN